MPEAPPTQSEFSLVAKSSVSSAVAVVMTNPPSHLAETPAIGVMLLIFGSSPRPPSVQRGADGSTQRLCSPNHFCQGRGSSVVSPLIWMWIAVLEIPRSSVQSPVKLARCWLVKVSGRTHALPPSYFGAKPLS